jgi:hypothetical protein
VTGKITTRTIRLVANGENFMRSLLSGETPLEIHVCRDDTVEAKEPRTYINVGNEWKVD